jgi:hypothetical protein
MKRIDEAAGGEALAGGEIIEQRPEGGFKPQAAGNAANTDRAGDRFVNFSILVRIKPTHGRFLFILAAFINGLSADQTYSLTVGPIGFILFAARSARRQALFRKGRSQAFYRRVAWPPGLASSAGGGQAWLKRCCC